MMEPKDNVATLLADAEKGEVVTVTSPSGKTTIDLRARQHIPFGHKIALVKIEKDEKVIKYGEVIGETTTPIEQGEHVHVHNVRSITWGKFK
jgi:(2R)-sulfolactate sulfo-lyase subunit alpha